MPLAELDANLPRDGSRPSGKGRPPLPTLPPPLPNPVSSMLRTSTEVGDLSPFARPPQRSHSRLSSRSASSYANGNANGNANLRPPRRPMPRNESRRFRPPLSRQDTGRSSLRSYHSSARPRYRPPTNRYGPDRRPSPAPAGIYSHPSLSNLRTRSGYRPTSPALSDAQSLPNYDHYNPRCRAPSLATAASSSASIFNQDMMYANREINNSTPSLRRFPSPAIPGPYQRYGWSPGPGRRTPIPPPWSALPEPDQIPTRPTTASSGQLYYDYTEAFTENFDQGEHISPLFSADHAIPEQGPPPSRQAQTPFGALAGSVFRPSEMATRHNRRESENVQGDDRRERQAENGQAADSRHQETENNQVKDTRYRETENSQVRDARHRKSEKNQALDCGKIDDTQCHSKAPENVSASN